MREILFRGKRKDNGKWVYGNYAVTDNNGKQHFVFQNKAFEFEVDSETVGQYTGLADKNGKKIFEGDIIKACFEPQNFNPAPYAVGRVIFENGTFKVVVCVSKNSIEHKVFEEESITAYSIEHNFLDRYYVLEVIGNTYDNPKLLEVQE